MIFGRHLKDKNSENPQRAAISSTEDARPNMLTKLYES